MGLWSDLSQTTLFLKTTKLNGRSIISSCFISSFYDIIIQTYAAAVSACLAIGREKPRHSKQNTHGKYNFRTLNLSHNFGDHVRWTKTVPADRLVTSYLLSAVATAIH